MTINVFKMTSALDIFKVGQSYTNKYLMSIFYPYVFFFSSPWEFEYFCLRGLIFC